MKTAIYVGVGLLVGAGALGAAYHFWGREWLQNAKSKAAVRHFDRASAIALSKRATARKTKEDGTPVTGKDIQKDFRDQAAQGFKGVLA